MQFSIEDSTGGAIDKAEQESITSCVEMIASTQKGSMPFMRDMGLKRIVPTDNTRAAFDEYADDLMEQIDTWENRVSAEDVERATENEIKVVLEYGESE